MINIGDIVEVNSEYNWITKKNFRGLVVDRSYQGKSMLYTVKIPNKIIKKKIYRGDRVFIRESECRKVF